MGGFASFSARGAEYRLQRVRSALTWAGAVGLLAGVTAAGVFFARGAVATNSGRTWSATRFTPPASALDRADPFAADSLLGEKAEAAGAGIAKKTESVQPGGWVQALPQEFAELEARRLAASTASHEGIFALGNLPFVTSSLVTGSPLEQERGPAGILPSNNRISAPSLVALDLGGAAGGGGSGGGGGGAGDPLGFFTGLTPEQIRDAIEDLLDDFEQNPTGDDVVDNTWEDGVEIVDNGDAGNNPDSPPSTSQGEPIAAPLPGPASLAIFAAGLAGMTRRRLAL